VALSLNRMTNAARSAIVNSPNLPNLIALSMGSGHYEVVRREAPPCRRASLAVALRACVSPRWRFGLVVVRKRA